MKDCEYKVKEREVEHLPCPKEYPGLAKLRMKNKTTTNPYILAHRKREQERTESTNIEKLKR